MNKKYINVSNFTEYKNLPKQTREFKSKLWPFCGFYKTPNSLPCDILNILESTKSIVKQDNGWNSFRAFVKQEYPIQYFFREGYENLWIFRKIHFWKYWYNERIHWPIRDFFKPRNKDLTKLIPNGWKETHKIIEEISERILVREGREIYEAWSTDEYPLWKERGAQALKFLDWIEVERPKLRAQLEIEWGKLEEFRGKDLTYNEKYGEIDRIEKLIFDGNTKMLNWIVENREIFD